ncbi:hypothetical protein ACFL27_16510 [candidate division CSSED10-310 bacterium]|uniref:PEP-CTERM sorting domain-containing protein n=1 Tax=candidate division CSSED10-310 bacterium TaxID=2855610 RepID=A0ABV6Z020_UNCC1
MEISILNCVFPEKLAVAVFDSCGGQVLAYFESETNSITWTAEMKTNGIKLLVASLSEPQLGDFDLKISYTEPPPVPNINSIGLLILIGCLGLLMRKTRVGIQSYLKALVDKH